MRRLRPDLVALALLGLASWVAPHWSAARGARTAVLNFGPNDSDYVRGFRPDWERDGRTRFRWASPAANVTLPVRVEGEGHRLRLRLRRHLVEPAHVRLLVEGRVVYTFDIQAHATEPYRTLEVALPRLEGRHPFVLSLEASSENPRPLAVALDWMEIDRGHAGRFLLLGSTRLALAALVALTFLVPRLAGGGTALSAIGAAALGCLAAWGVSRDVIAAERIVREGAAAYIVVGVAALAFVRLARRALGIEAPRQGGVLATLVLAALALRLSLLLHPQFYYPDVRTHAMFALQLARRGLATFLEQFTANQYRFSLGLQFENGHWYALPYPPLFYFFSAPLISLFQYRAEVAVSIFAAAVNSLEALVVFALARRLSGRAPCSLAAAAVHGLLPLFLARLTLAYFPALVGHALDAAVVLFLLANLERCDRPRVVLALGGLVSLALLMYTQALVNFAILLPLYLLLEASAGRAPLARRQLGLALAGIAGASLALLLFYGRYLPVLRDMQHGRPLPEESILTERLAQQRAEPAEPEEADPYTGADLDLLRGVRKAGWRLYVFYGPFAPAVVAGVVLLMLRLVGSPRRLVAAWALTYLLLNLLSGGLPGPNLLRYNKDLEIVAPLFCVALAAFGFWIWERGTSAARAMAMVYGGGYVAFALTRAITYLTEKIVMER